VQLDTQDIPVFRLKLLDPCVVLTHLSCLSFGSQMSFYRFLVISVTKSHWLILLLELNLRCHSTSLFQFTVLAHAIISRFDTAHVTPGDCPNA
jgi:hypothetical protein